MRHLCEDCIERRENEAGAAARYAEWRRTANRADTLFACVVTALCVAGAVAAVVDRRETDAYFAAKVAAGRVKAARMAPEMRPVAVMP